MLLKPVEGVGIADVVAVPDASQTPEMIVGLSEGVAAESQYARRLAEVGCRVIVPVIIDRKAEVRPHLGNREYVYRSAFELGRHIIGYEVQKVLGAVDWFAKEGGDAAKVGVIGWGEGGMLALYAGAIDPRVDAVCVSGYIGDRKEIWREPIDRNVFGLLERFGDGEIGTLIAPRGLVVEAAKGPEVVIEGKGVAPGRVVTPKVEEVKREAERCGAQVVVSGGGTGAYGSEAALRFFLDGMKAKSGVKMVAGGVVEKLGEVDARERHGRQVRELDRHNQWLLDASADVRREFMKGLDTSSAEKYARTSAEYREKFYRDVIGRFEGEMLAANPRTRKVYDNDKWVGYEVVLDVFPEVMAYGILIVPKDVKAGEKRPVVVCQHGLEGRPQHLVGKEGEQYYRAFAARLAERGFVTFAPQNLYIFGDRFRTLQRKANPIGKTLFSVITPQHRQILDWLKTLAFVDGERIGFYGLSYGGKTAMRVPAILTDYKLSICSADFNEWVRKNASTKIPQSYVWTSEYEIFEWDLGSTFNYAEMAALIAPRPFMVERGHFDGVAADEWVGFEFAKVRHLYSARLGVGERCEIEWFVGPHTINGKGTYEFLHRHLDWKK